MKPKVKIEVMGGLISEIKSDIPIKVIVKDLDLKKTYSYPVEVKKNGKDKVCSR